MDVQPSSALARALSFYDERWDAFIENIAASGAVFEPFGKTFASARPLYDAITARGGVVRNGGASVVAGHLSLACECCTGDCVSRTFCVTLDCHRSCFFCFNDNQQGYRESLDKGCLWKEDLDQLRKQEPEVACVGLTGGEPLLKVDETCEFFRTARAYFPKAHLRLYTSGDHLTPDILRRLEFEGLNEIRISIKPESLEGAPRGFSEKSSECLSDDLAQGACKGVSGSFPSDSSQAAYCNALKRIALACEYIETVMVEMPVMPDAEAPMRQLLVDLDALGVFGINLLELCYPNCRWEAFAQRGYLLKNPPFPVLYRWNYAGGVPVAGSEAACLRLIMFALEKRLSLGVHYCSLENKHRSETRMRNEHARIDRRIYAFDTEDFYLKTAKVFGSDCERVQKLLDEKGIAYQLDAGDSSVAFHPQFLALFDGADISPVFSYGIAEEETATVEEVEIEPIDMAQCHFCGADNVSYC